MRNSLPQPRPGNAFEFDLAASAREPVLGRRQCESYAEECATLAAQCDNAELRRLLLQVASSWRWLADVGFP